MMDVSAREWKTKNKKYLLEMEKFLDIVDSIKDENLREQIITQMLKCDEALTKAAEDFFWNIIKNEKAIEI